MLFRTGKTIKLLALAAIVCIIYISINQYLFESFLRRRYITFDDFPQSYSSALQTSVSENKPLAFNDYSLFPNSTTSIPPIIHFIWFRDLVSPPTPSLHPQTDPPSTPTNSPAPTTPPTSPTKAPPRPASAQNKTQPSQSTSGTPPPPETSSQRTTPVSSPPTTPTNTPSNGSTPSSTSSPTTSAASTWT